MLAAGVAAAQTGGAAQTDGFDDVPEGAFFSDPVSELAEEGVFEGTECDEDGSRFCPDDPIDRKTMAVWTVRVLDGRNPFAVPRDQVQRRGRVQLLCAVHRAHGRTRRHRGMP